MMGMGKYEYSKDKNDPGPYDEESILKGFYELHKENPGLSVDSILEHILREMLDGEVKEIFASIFYIYTQKYFEKKGMAAFVLNNSILEKTNKTINDRKAELETTDGIKEFYVYQNVMKVLRKLNNLSISDLGISLFQE